MTFKLKAHQRAILAETILYAFGRRRKALTRLEKYDDYREPFPLRRLYDRYKRADRRIVDEGINVWFNRETRGDSLTKTCSMWSVRSTARISEPILEFLSELYAQNIEHMVLLRSHINRKKDAPEVVVTTTFRFKDELQAEMFIELFGVLVPSETI